MNIKSGRYHPSLEPRICPFLGLADDERTALAFPSDWNSCHHCAPLHAVKLDHQQSYCLSPNYKNCLVHLQKSKDALPRDLRNRRPVHPKAGRSARQIILVLALLALVSLVAFAFQSGAIPVSGFPGTILQPAGPDASLPVDGTATPGLIPSPTAEMTPPTATLTPLPTFTPVSPVPSALPSTQPTARITRIPHDIDTLIGINHLFKVHRVKQGESVDLLAIVHGTTVNAIAGVNYNFSTPLWVNQVVIIPVNQTDVSELPPFEAYRVGAATTVQALAAELDVDPAQLQYYNGLGSSTDLVEGEWLVVPREKSGT